MNAGLSGFAQGFAGGLTSAWKRGEEVEERKRQEQVRIGEAESQRTATAEQARTGFYRDMLKSGINEGDQEMVNASLKMLRKVDPNLADMEIKVTPDRILDKTTIERDGQVGTLVRERDKDSKRILSEEFLPGSKSSKLTFDELLALKRAQTTETLKRGVAAEKLGRTEQALRKDEFVELSPEQSEFFGDRATTASDTGKQYLKFNKLADSTVDTLNTFRSIADEYTQLAADMKKYGVEVDPVTGRIPSQAVQQLIKSPEFNTLAARADRIFQQFTRKPITGAQAAVKELKDLQSMAPNLKRDVNAETFAYKLVDTINMSNRSYDRAVDSLWKAQKDVSKFMRKAPAELPLKGSAATRVGEALGITIDDEEQAKLADQVMSTLDSLLGGK